MSSHRKLKNGRTVHEIEGDEKLRVKQFCPPYQDKFFRVQPEGYLFPPVMADVLDLIHDFKFRDTDVVTMTFPKSGTTWSQEILWTLVHNPNFDNPHASLSTDFRSPHIECDMFLDGNPEMELPLDHKIRQIIEQLTPGHGQDKHIMFAFCNAAKSPRVIKTHLPFSMLPENMKQNAKILYIARNPRDLICSRFEWYRLLKTHSFTGTLDDFLDLCLEENLVLQPYFKHVKEALDLKDHPNVLFMHFEDLKKDPVAGITQISNFLGLDRTPDQIKKVAEYTNFGVMKQRSTDKTVDAPMEDGGKMFNQVVKDETGGFFRKGEADTWKQYFNTDQVSRIEAWIAQNTNDFPRDFRYLIKK